MYTQEQIDLIIFAQEKQIRNPARAVVNSECAFVKETISKTDVKLACDYWSWVCYSGLRKDPTLFGDVVHSNELILARIDSEQTMPSWGYSGT